MRGPDIDLIAKGFWFASIQKVKELKKYVEKRKDEEPVKFAPLYIDILYEINKILKEKENGSKNNT